MDILDYSFEGEGMKRVFENDKWTVGIKNWKPANDLANFDNLERHNETDELFVLLEGSCTLIFAKEKEGMLEMGAAKMQKNRVYNIPRTMWHNTITEPGTKLVLIEDVNTSMENSDILPLTQRQIEAYQNILA